ncbi:MAG: DUF2330 domain-containing protein [Candidatus Altiarchaeota archaeon]
MNVRKSSVCVLILLSVLASADRGMVPVTQPDAVLYEPGQKAIIAWNGTTEILVLSTDVKASKDTMVLEILPLPSEPYRIVKANRTSFDNTIKIIRIHAGPAPSSTKLGGRSEGYQPGVEIVFHEKIGAHDITVAKANNIHDFVDWGDDFLRKNLIGYSISDSRLEGIVADYIKDGVNYFVFDLINLTSAQRSTDPILYEFRNDYMFYPMSISSLTSGDTHITIFTLTSTVYAQEDLTSGLRFMNYDTGGWKTPIQFKVTRRELADISLESGIGQMFPWEPTLTSLEYKGPLQTLREDFIVGDTYWRKKAVESYMNAVERRADGELNEALAEAAEAQKLFEKISDKRGASKSKQLAEEITVEIGGVVVTTTLRVLPPVKDTTSTIPPQPAPPSDSGFNTLSAVILALLAVSLIILAKKQRISG